MRGEHRRPECRLTGGCIPSVRPSVCPAVGEEGREAAVAIALMSGALANVWLVILRFRSLPVAEHKGNGETPASFSEKKGVSGAD